jgi:osmotically-inducible protein OsmY
MKDNGHKHKDRKEHPSVTINKSNTLLPHRNILTASRARQGVGTYKGKGPKSYRRSDDRILEEISDHMCDNPYLNASEINVEVKNCEVVLTGLVEDRQSKRLAEDIAEAVSGVENVENRLRIRLRGI